MPAPRALALATSVTYPGTTEHIHIVRADLRAVLHDCPMADDVILCASELAANAATHSRSRLPGSTFTVRVKISPGDYAWVEVEDDGGPKIFREAQPIQRRKLLTRANGKALRGSDGSTHDDTFCPKLCREPHIFITLLC